MNAWSPRFAEPGDGPEPLYDDELAADYAALLEEHLPITATPAGACLRIKHHHRHLAHVYLTMRSLHDSGNPVEHARDAIAGLMA